MGAVQRRYHRTSGVPEMTGKPEVIRKTGFFAKIKSKVRVKQTSQGDLMTKNLMVMSDF